MRSTSALIRQRSAWTPSPLSRLRRTSVASHYASQYPRLMGTEAGYKPRDERSATKSSKSEDRPHRHRNLSTWVPPAYSDAVHVDVGSNQKHRRQSTWVPPAYRGAVKEAPDRPSHEKKFTKKKHYNRRPSKEASPKSHRKPKGAQDDIDWKIRGLRKAVDPKRIQLFDLCGKVSRTAASYRRQLSREGFAASELDISPPEKATLEECYDFLKKLPRVLSEIQELSKKGSFDFFVEDKQQHDQTAPKLIALDSMEQIEQTEKAFRSLCLAVREVAIKAAEIYDHYDFAKTEAHLDIVMEPLDVSLSALEALLEIRERRRSLVDGALAQEKERMAKEAPKSTGWTAAVQNLFSSIFSTQSSEDEEEKRIRNLVHNQLESGVPVGVFNQLLENFLRLQISPDISSSTPRNSVDGAMASRQRESMYLTWKAGTRLITLLNQFERSLVADPNSKGGSRAFLGSFGPRHQQGLLRSLSLVGTLESAMYAERILESLTPAQHANSELLAWRAYLQVTRNESVTSRERIKAAKYLLKRWMTRWNDDFPSSKTLRVDMAVMVLDAITMVGIDAKYPLDKDFQKYANTVVFRTIGNRTFSRIMSGISDPFEKVDSTDMAIIDAICRVYASFDIRKAQTLIEQMKADPNHRVPSTGTIDTFLLGLQKHYDNEKSSKPDAQPDQDANLALSLLEYAMTRRNSTEWPSEETFRRCFRLVTLLNPPTVGEILLKWYSNFQIFSCFHGQVQMNQTDFTRVLWGIWQQSQRESAKSSQFNGCNHAWEIFSDMDTRSSPLLMSTREVRSRKNGSKLYDVDLSPPNKAYELVIRICADAKSPSDFPSAHEITKRVSARARKRNVELDENTLKLVELCEKRAKEHSAKQ